MKIGDEVYIHGYVDEIRRDTIIIRNQGGYFGTAPEEVLSARSEGKKMDKSIVKQVITTWYDPSKKVPSNSDFVVATVSGKVGEVTLDHELMIANWVADEGWYFYDEYIDAERDSYLIKVDAWCDLKPYR